MSTDKKNPDSVGMEGGEAPEPDGRFPDWKAKRRHRTLIDAQMRPYAPRKQRLVMALDRDVVDAVRTGEPGWQLQINETLKVFLKEHDTEEL